MKTDISSLPNVSKVFETVGLGTCTSSAINPFLTVLYQVQLRMHLHPDKAASSIMQQVREEKTVYRSMLSNTLLHSVRRGGRNAIQFHGPEVLEEMGISAQSGKALSAVAGSVFNIISKQIIVSSTYHNQLNKPLIEGDNAGKKIVSLYKNLAKGGGVRILGESVGNYAFYAAYDTGCSIVRSMYNLKPDEPFNYKQSMMIAGFTGILTTAAYAPLDSAINLAMFRPLDTGKLRVSRVVSAVRKEPTFAQAKNILLETGVILRPFLPRVYTIPGVAAGLLNNTVGAVLYLTAQNLIEWGASKNHGDRVVTVADKTSWEERTKSQDKGNGVGL